MYVIQDDTLWQSHPRPSTIVGLDGHWVGATRANSYFYLSTDPGDHNVCVQWQSSLIVAIVPRGTRSAAIHLTVQAEGVYYVTIQDIWPGSTFPGVINLLPTDPAQGRLLMSHAAFTTFHPR